MPEPTIISRGRAGVHSRWPGWAVERATWIHQQLETGYTLVEISEQVKAGQAPVADGDAEAGDAGPDATKDVGE